MNFYETMYIVHPILEMGRLHDLIIETEKIIKERGGEILFTNVMGKKRMAYPIQKQKFGTYVLVQYKSDGSKNNVFSLDLEHNPNVLRHMIINIEESEVKEQTEDIKDQISGLSRPRSSKQAEEKTEISEAFTGEAEKKDKTSSETKTKEKQAEEELKTVKVDDSSAEVVEEDISEATADKEE